MPEASTRVPPDASREPGTKVNPMPSTDHPERSRSRALVFCSSRNSKASPPIGLYWISVKRSGESAAPTSNWASLSALQLVPLRVRALISQLAVSTGGAAGIYSTAELEMAPARKTRGSLPSVV